MPCLVCGENVHILKGQEEYVFYEHGLAHRSCVSTVIEEVEA